MTKKKAKSERTAEVIPALSFGHMAESNWYKAEAARLSEENAKLKKKLSKLGETSES